MRGGKPGERGRFGQICGPRLVLFAGGVLIAISVAGYAAAVDRLAERPPSGGLGHPAIGYYTRPTHDAVSDLVRRIDSGTATIAFDDTSGYLRSVLDALHLPVESQMLVMSKTGIQGLHTDPSNPRAIYFNDAVTVGYIRGAPLLEFAVQDPEQGVVFYALDQKRQARPLFDRRQGCLTCHQVYSTLHVPGMLARSVFVTREGLSLGQFGSYDPDDRTPFAKRWGGWYVTGTHGSMRHMGNAFFSNAEPRDAAISEATLNRTSLDGLFDARTYPSAHSDIVALMVFQHQARMSNLITRVGWDARLAAHQGEGNGAAGVSRARAGSPLGESRAWLQDAIRELVDALLFVDEEPLTATVKGTTPFAAMFAAQGPADSRGRSLRQLDLEHRLQRYPCSYMIYSAAFRALPAALRAGIYARMWEILSGRDAAARYERLSDADRRAIVEILGETLPDLPADFRRASALK